jgi:hypothetical protein
MGAIFGVIWGFGKRRREIAFNQAGCKSTPVDTENRSHFASSRSIREP